MGVNPISQRVHKDRSEDIDVLPETVLRRFAVLGTRATAGVTPPPQ